MKAFLLMLVLCAGGMAQEFIGVNNKGMAFYVMPPAKNERAVKFIGIISPYYHDRLVIDKNNYLMTVFIANCDNYRYVAKRYFEVIKGVGKQGTYEEEIKQAVKPQMIYKAIQKSCGNKDEEYY